MKLYRFSPIKSEKELMKAIEYTHFACFELCKNVFGKYLPVAGNLGIFSHYDDEYNYLTKLRQKLTDNSDNWNEKYYRLHKPIVIPAKGDIPETTYTYLYIRHPDPYRPQVGDADFVLEEAKYKEFKRRLLGGEKIKGVRVFERPELDMIELYNPDIDAAGFVRTQDMEATLKK